MKKSVIFLITLLLILNLFPVSAMAENATLVISKDRAENVFSDNKYGINLSYDSYAIDGGLCSELAANGSFEEQNRYYTFGGGDCVLGSTDYVAKTNPTYIIIKSDYDSGSGYTVTNHGYGENEDNMPLVKGEKYSFSCMIKNVDYDGSIIVSLDNDSKGDRVSLSTEHISKRGWSKVSTTLKANDTSYGRLVMEFAGTGTLQLDNISLVPQSSYGYGDSEWKYSSLRNDFVSALKYVNPSFITYDISADSWKNTIGETSKRQRTATSNNFALHEFLQLCSDLNTTAIPVITGEDFEKNSKQYNDFRQSVLDMIEYANGDAITSYNGALRAANGRESSFALEYICLSGEFNCIDDIKKAVEKKYDDIAVLTDNDIAIVGNTTSYGKGAAKSNMATAVMDTNDMLSPDGLISYQNAFALDGARDVPSLIWFDGYDISLSPTYYSQLILANNSGPQTIVTDLSAENISEKISLDAAKGIVYITLINAGNASKKVDVLLDGFEDIKKVSLINISSGYKSCANLIGRQYIAPQINDEVNFDNSSFTAKLSPNSVDVYRVACSELDSAKDIYFYQPPQELDTNEKTFVPLAVKVIIPCIAIAIPVGGVIGFLLYRDVISKNKKQRKKAKGENEN